METKTLARLLAKAEASHARTLKSVQRQERLKASDARKLKRVRGFKGPTRYKMRRIKEIKARTISRKSKIKQLRRKFIKERMSIRALKSEWKRRAGESKRIVTVIKWDVLAVEVDEKGNRPWTPVWQSGNMSVDGMRDFYPMFQASGGMDLAIFKGTRYGRWKVLDSSGRFYVYFKEQDKRYFSVDYYFDPMKFV